MGSAKVASTREPLLAILGPNRLKIDYNTPILTNRALIALMEELVLIHMLQ